MDAWYQDARSTIYNGDCLEVLRALPDASVDAVVTDPPYGLEFMGKEWDAPWKCSGDVVVDPANVGGFQDGNGGNPYSRSRIRYGTGDGFQQWCELWAVECLRVLKPGGHLLAFGGTRTWHRLACAIEDAGFEVRDCLMWLYGSGFPKSLDVSKAMDKNNKDDRRRRFLRFTEWMRSTGITAKQINEITDSFMGSHYLTDREQPAVPTEDMFSKLRPHLPTVPDDIEELVRMRTVEAENFKRREVIGKSLSGHGSSHAGQENAYGFKDHFNITAPNTDLAKQWHGWGTALKPAYEPAILARKPLRGTVADNVAQWGTGGLNIDGCRVGDDVVGWQGAQGGSADVTQSQGRNYRMNAGEPRPVSGRWPANVILDEDAAAALDAQSGVSKSGKLEPHHKLSASQNYAMSGDNQERNPRKSFGGDTGGASRFFYTAKASRSEREAGLDGVEAQSIGAKGNGLGRTCEVCGASVLEGCACENRTYSNQKRANHHPTVKPISLMRYMVRLVAPRGAVVLDPFMGSGSTGCAAMVEGMQFIGIDITPEYVDIARRRIAEVLVAVDAH